MSGEVSMKCPKCGGRTFDLYERLEVADCFPVRDGVAKPKSPDENMPGQLGFTAHCGPCGHNWTPRYKSAMAVIDAERAAREGGRSDV